MIGCRVLLAALLLGQPSMINLAGLAQTELLPALRSQEKWRWVASHDPCSMIPVSRPRISSLHRTCEANGENVVLRVFSRSSFSVSVSLRPTTDAEPPAVSHCRIWRAGQAVSAKPDLQKG